MEKKDIFSEEIFVEYMRILDGYHTRISGDEETRRKIKTALKSSTKEIKKLICTEDGRPLFEKTIKSVIPDWKYNSAHMEQIAGWIASGFLSKTSLSYRIQEIDNQYLQIIKKNAVCIENLRRDKSIIEGKSEDNLVELYFKELGDTRNYYSHYKLEKTGVLESVQMWDTINVLKATIISIFMRHMGLDIDLIRKILQFDSELNFQTMCLRRDGEYPFAHPSELSKGDGH